MPAQQQNRKDILQAYRLMTDRMALALIAGEPDSPNQPLRRRNTATISALLVGVIVAAGFAVLGLIFPGGARNDLNHAGTLTIDKDTGTPYVPCGGQRVLCPVLNYSSARLALKSANVTQVDIDQKSLAGYTIGPTLGIAGLPQDLPTRADLIKGGTWSVCTEDGGASSTLIGGRQVGGATSLPPSQAALVSAAGQYWVLWSGTRMLISVKDAKTIYPLGSPTPVSTTWLNAIPEGTPFAAPVIPGQNTPVTGPAGTGSAMVGQVYTASGQNWVLESDGKLAGITPLQAKLLEIMSGAARPISLQAASDNLSSKSVSTAGMPTTAPAIPPGPAASSTLCVDYGPNLARQITTGGTVPAGTATGGGNGDVDQVVLPPGQGALIGVTASAVSQPRPLSWFLLDGTTRYGMTSSAVPGMLGYTLPADETVLPAAVVDLIPQGPAFDPAKASQRASG